MVGVQKVRNFFYSNRFSTHLFLMGLVVLFFACVVAPHKFALASSPAVTIGFTPSSFSSEESPEQIAANVLELSNLIQKKTGLKVTPYVATSPDDLFQKVKEKKVDFAFMSALNFVEAESKIKLKVLLKKVWEQGYYHSVLVVKKTSKLRKPSDLRGKRIAFVDADSASGYLYPISHFREIGFSVPSSFKSVVYSGSHEKSLTLLERNDVDAVAVFSNDKAGSDSAWTNRKNATKSSNQNFRVVWASAAIPNDPFCVREDFYERHPKAAHELMFGLIEMNDDPTFGPELRRLLGVRGLMVATSQQYAPVRNMYQNLPKLETKP